MLAFGIFYGMALILFIVSIILFLFNKYFVGSIFMVLSASSVYFGYRIQKSTINSASEYAKLLFGQDTNSLGQTTNSVDRVD